MDSLNIDLEKEVNPMWPVFFLRCFHPSLCPTGSKVISRKLSLDSLAELESVLQRPPLIWDNLHANDYDTRRLFLGPFKGRDPQLRNQLRGLLLNPNCEFEANYIPLHTLGSWHRAEKDNVKGEGRFHFVYKAILTLPDRINKQSLLVEMSNHLIF